MKTWSKTYGKFDASTCCLQVALLQIQTMGVNGISAHGLPACVYVDWGCRLPWIRNGEEQESGREQEQWEARWFPMAVVLHSIPEAMLVKASTLG